MAENSLVLEQLRLIRRQLDSIEDTLAEHGERLTGLEQGQAALRRDQAHDVTSVAQHSVRFDRVNRRLDRIERRLELRDEI